MNTSSVNWFEIPVNDMARAERFYSAVLAATFAPNCATSQQIQAMSTFVCKESACNDSPDSVTGCLIQGEGYAPATAGSMVYLNAAPSIDAALMRVRDAGGEVALPKTALPPGLGFFAHIIDSEGNRVGLHALQ
jgi:predicted enzyme related to lactoylglutathione lyase